MKDRDDARVNQNSGVSIMAKTMQVASAKDTKPVVRDMVFYSVIKEIWMLDYFAFKIPIFKCDWVENKNSIRIDELEFTLVELGKVGHKFDSFTLASQAKQVFYVPDQLDTKWSIALSAPQSEYYDEGNGYALFDCGENDTQISLLPNVESFDVVDESSSNYAREDVKGTWIDN